MASPKVIAAAHAAASWARARRAAWAAPPPAPPEAFGASSDDRVPYPAEAPATPTDALPYSYETLESHDHAEAHPGSHADAPTFRAPSAQPAHGPRVSTRTLFRWAAIVGLAAGAAAATYVLSRSGLFGAAPEPIAGARPEAAVAQPQNVTTGTLHVSSTPAGARVLVDGRERGQTPLSLDDLSAGTHQVILESPRGTVERTVTVAPDRPVTIDESIFAGWVAVFSPIELIITEGSRTLRPDERSEIMLAAGRHVLRFANNGLGFEEVRHIEVKPGERQRVTIAPPGSTLVVTASQPAEVWLDGTLLGGTPLSGTPVALGTHELVVRRGGDQRRLTITVTTRPFVTHIEFQPDPRGQAGSH